MRSGIMLFLVVVFSSRLVSAQDQHVLTFAGEKVTINCNARDPLGFCKTIMITSTTPLMVFFMKNDKGEITVTGNNINVYYKKNEKGEDVADITIDGKNWWSIRCLYYITTWTNASSVVYNGNRMDLVGTLQFEQTGFPFSISKLTKAEGF